jgi:hypothetical protein
LYHDPFAVSALVVAADATKEAYIWNLFSLLCAESITVQSLGLLKSIYKV